MEDLARDREVIRRKMLHHSRYRTTFHMSLLHFKWYTRSACYSETASRQTYHLALLLLSNLAGRLHPGQVLILCNRGLTKVMLIFTFISARKASLNG